MAGRIYTSKYPAIAVGQRYGRLTAIRPLGQSIWLFGCDCGNDLQSKTTAVAAGRTKSCGCLKRERTTERNKASARHGLSRSPTHNSWAQMLQRCTDPNHDAFERYGGRGIRVCERWLVFENFYADMGVRPEGMTLDRYPDKDGPYEKNNCRWATRSQQNKNRRPLRRNRVGKFTTAAPPE